MFEDGLRRSLRQLAADGAELGGYGLPHGHLALRLWIAESLAERQITAGAEHVLLTQGSSQALDLAARRLLRAGDAVLVDDPGYPNLMFMLRFLDQLRRVVYIGSYSKTISPNLRVGHIVARPELLDDLAQLKMVSGLTSSDLTERLVFGTLSEGRWRKHLKSLHSRLAEAHGQAGRWLADLGPGRRRRAVPAGGAGGHHAGAWAVVPGGAAHHRLAALQRGVLRRRTHPALPGGADPVPGARGGVRHAWPAPASTATAGPMKARTTRPKPCTASACRGPAPHPA